MASKKYGVKPTEWWKHLRWEKRRNNKKVRKLGQKLSEEMDYFEDEHQEVRKTFNLEEVIEFSKKHRVEVIMERDLQYMCYIDGDGYSTGLTPLGALIYGIKTYNEYIQKEKE